jgi:hypothetical protein
MEISGTGLLLRKRFTRFHNTDSMVCEIGVHFRDKDFRHVTTCAIAHRLGTRRSRMADRRLLSRRAHMATPAHWVVGCRIGFKLFVRVMACSTN